MANGLVTTLVYTLPGRVRTDHDVTEVEVVTRLAGVGAVVVETVETVLLA